MAIWNRIRSNLIVWIPISVGVIALLLGAITFYYQDVYRPSATSNVSLTLELTQVGHIEKSGARFLTLRLTATASNTGSDTIYPLTNHWLGWGIKYAARSTGETAPAGALKHISEAVNSSDSRYAQRYLSRGATELVVGGQMFGDYKLNPGETLSHEMIFFVPDGRFDTVEVVGNLPLVRSNDDLKLRWLFPSEVDSDYQLYRQRPGAEATEELSIAETKRLIRDRRIGFVTSRAVLALDKLQE